MRTQLAPLESGAVSFVAHNMRALDREEIFATRFGNDAAAVAAETVALARFGCVAWQGGAAAAVVCAIPLWSGVWSVGMYATDRWPSVALTVTHWIARTLIPDLIVDGAHRAECRSLSTHEAAHRWLERLGATREAVLAGYGRNREDFYLYVWTRKTMGEINVLRTLVTTAATTDADP